MRVRVGVSMGVEGGDGGGYKAGARGVLAHVIATHCTLSCWPRRLYAQRASGLPPGGFEKCWMNSLYFLCRAFSVTRSATQARRRVEGGVQAETCANGLWQDRGERAVVHCACAYACVSTAWRTARVHLDG